MSQLFLDHQQGLHETTLYSADSVDGKLTVIENEKYRWFTLGGQAIQSILAKENPEDLLLPVPKSMLLSLLWTKPLQILSLGMGGGGFERALAPIKNCQITSVEKNQTIIEVAQQYFSLPKTATIHCSDAFDYLRSNNQQFDLILIDLFSQQLNPSFLRESNFFTFLKKASTQHSVISLNIYAENEQDFLNVLMATRGIFKHVMLISFKNYKNVVVMVSNSPFPNKSFLEQANKHRPLTINFDFAINAITPVS